MDASVRWRLTPCTVRSGHGRPSKGRHRPEKRMGHGKGVRVPFRRSHALAWLR
jgi:hypothetical protein